MRSRAAIRDPACFLGAASVVDRARLLASGLPSVWVFCDREVEKMHARQGSDDVHRLMELTQYILVRTWLLLWGCTARTAALLFRQRPIS
jgi:hypothetical protein